MSRPARRSQLALWAGDTALASSLDAESHDSAIHDDLVVQSEIAGLFKFDDREAMRPLVAWRIVRVEVAQAADGMRLHIRPV